MLSKKGTEKFNSCVDFILKEFSHAELVLIRQVVEFKLKNRNLEVAGNHKHQKRIVDEGIVD